MPSCGDVAADAAGEPRAREGRVCGVSAATTTPGPGRPGLTPPPDAAAPVRHPDAPAPGQLLGAHYDQCFGCGQEQPHGLHLVTTAGEGVSVTAEFTVRPAHQGAPGLAHGGILTTALDETLGSLSWLLRTVAVTGRLETDFLRPVPVGTTLHLSARCLAVAGRKIYSTAEGRIGAPDGPLAIRADALFIRVSLEHFTRNGRPEEIKAALADPDQLKVARAFEVNP
jgi:acyl-coenzyme A thioesterase PaaI-like protein